MVTCQGLGLLTGCGLGHMNTSSPGGFRKWPPGDRGSWSGSQAVASGGSPLETEAQQSSVTHPQPPQNGAESGGKACDFSDGFWGPTPARSPL